MPHFIIECSEDVLKQASPETIMNAVYETANASGLFAVNDVKVRIRPYHHYKLGEDKQDFIHVFAYIMQGRAPEQRAALSRSVTSRLNEMFPHISILSMNVSEFESFTYCNRALLDPRNKSGDRHFK